MQHKKRSSRRKNSRRINRGRWTIGLIFALILIGGVIVSQSRHSNASAPIQMTGMTLDNAPLSLSELRGQVIMLNFWATWCPPCRAEMPTIQAAYEKYHRQGFTVLAVNASENPNELYPFVNQLGLKFPIILDPDGAIRRQFQVQSFPTSLFIDSSGVLYTSHSGAVTPTQLADVIEMGFARSPA